MSLIEFFRRSIPAPPRASSTDLFDEEFQRKLDSLALVSRRVFAGRLRAERRTKKTGSGIEFADHRAYQPGDDFRTLDWNVYQRFDKLLVRLFEEEEDLAVYLLVDVSGSMTFGDGLKLRYAKQLTAALAYVGLTHLDRVSVVALSDRVIATMPETRGKGRIFKVFRFLEQMTAGGETDLEPAMKAFVAQHKRRGLAVLLSDLYDPAGFERGINILRYHHFDPFVIHVLDARENTPSVKGDVLLVDCETGDSREVTVTPKILARFAELQFEAQKSVERFCASHQVTYIGADIQVPFDELILRVFRRGGFLK